MLLQNGGIPNLIKKTTLTENYRVIENEVVTEGREPFAIAKAVTKLKDMLDWSDRLGSDETHEIGEIIKLLEGY